jgi:pilus assembly protein Flp/PilA
MERLRFDGPCLGVSLSLCNHHQQTTSKEEKAMSAKMRKLYADIRALIHKEEGQDLIEYTLVVALIALAATAGMQTVAADINAAFTSIGGKLVTYTS